MITEPWFYAVAIPTAIIIGLSKGGFSVVGLLAVPLLALVISPVQAAAITLPVLVCSDVIALISYRGSYDRETLRVMIPGAIVGVGIGWVTAAWVTENEIRLIVGVMSVVFALNYWLSPDSRMPRRSSHARGTIWAIITGFTSFVSHAGGPPFQVYAAPLRLEPRILAGTAVITFAVINAVKLGPYFLLGQFDATNLTASAILIPIALVTTILTVWFVRRVNTDVFYRWIYISIFVVGLYLSSESALEIIWPWVRA